MTPDEFAAFGMNDDEADRVRAAIRRLAKECIDVTQERLRRGERPNLGAVARGAVVGIRQTLVALELSQRQREVFLMLAAAEVLRGYLQNLERTATKRRVN
jgi:hypothetical protein